MSVNSQMTAIANAIRTKTSRSDTLTLDEMASAIAGISAGPAIQRQEGTLTGRYNVDVAVQCGFKPDVVVIFTPGYYVDGASREENLDFFFAEQKTTNSKMSMSRSSMGIYEGIATAVATGFSVKMRAYSTSWSQKTSMVDNQSFQYVALKYTA